MDNIANLEQELKRIRKEGSEGLWPKSAVGTVLFRAWTSSAPLDLISKAESVLLAVAQASAEAWPSEDTWNALLPQWFVEACASPMTQAEAQSWLDAWKRLSAEERAEVERNKRWSLPDWLYWMESERRTWFWWQARSIEGGAEVEVMCDAWPCPWGSLNWLLRAAGAASVALIEDGDAYKVRT